MDEQESTEHTVQFAVAISTDRDHFLRRCCPTCGREFKTLIDQADLQWALASQVQRMGLEIGGQPGLAEDHPPDVMLHCPYCGFEGKSQESHTEETMNYFKRVLHREYVLPKIDQMFSGLEDAFGKHSSTGGLFSISMRFEHARSILPSRPIHGPEPADMKIIEFLCCGKKIRVSDRWTDIHRCTFCGSEVAVQV